MNIPRQAEFSSPDLEISKRDRLRWKHVAKRCRLGDLQYKQISDNRLFNLSYGESILVIVHRAERLCVLFFSYQPFV